MPQPNSDFSTSATNEVMAKALQDVSKLKSPEPDTQQTLSFGQKLVGLNFNSSNDTGVDKAKRLCAELADLVQNHWENKEHTMLENILYNHTVGEILNAQMNVVKLLTLKY